MDAKAPAAVKRHNCDLCSSNAWAPLPLPKPRGIGICQVCGFVYVRDRRASHEIAADWSNVYGEGYNPDGWPAVKARLYYVREWIDSEYGLEHKSVLDIGAGTGTFLKILFPNLESSHDPLPIVGIEPSTAAESRPYIARGSVEDDLDLGQFDFVTINWTLENCHDPIKMLDYARRRCKPDGRVIVATGSRILVPYKKPLSSYLGDNAPDLHCFRWSEETLAGAFHKAGLWVDKQNPSMECDWLVMSGQPTDLTPKPHLPYDPPQEVRDYFRLWQETWP
jgi:SAM-dependent methyltransferase